MGLLDRSALLKRDVLEIEKVELGNGDFVFVRQMTGRERDLFEGSMLKEVKDEKGNVTGYDRQIEDFRAKLAVNTLCDENGNNLLQPTDYPKLSANISAAKLEKIVNVAQRLNKITEEDKEGLIKNSSADIVGDSHSNSAES